MRIAQDEESTGKRKLVDLIEVLLLVAAAPFLLFPERFPAGTLFGLISVVALWTVRWLFVPSWLPVTPFNLAQLVWLVGVMLGVGVSADPALTLPKAAGLLLGISVWRTILVQGDSPHRLAWGVRLFVVAACGMLLLGFITVEWRARTTILGSITSLLLRESKWPSIAGDQLAHPNELAGALTLVLPFTAALAWQQLRQRRLSLSGIFIAGVLVMGVSALILTQSRAGWAGGLAGAVALLLLQRLPGASQSAIRRHRWAMLGGACIFLLATLMIVTAERSLVPRVQEVVATESTPPGSISSLETLLFRFEVWHYAVEAIGDFPLTGTGLGTFRATVLRLYPIQAFPNHDVVHAHNVFLQVALDTGIGGLVGYLALLFVAWTTGYWLLRRSTAYTAVAAGVLSSLVAFHVYGLVDTIAPGGKPGLLFWWLLGLLTAAYQLSQAQQVDGDTKGDGNIEGPFLTRHG